MKITISLGRDDSLVAELEDAIRSAAEEEIEAKLCDYRCPLHALAVGGIALSGGHFTNDAFDDVTLKISGCCTRAEEDAYQLLGLVLTTREPTISQ